MNTIVLGNNYKVNIENCGGFFDDYVLMNGNELVAVRSDPKDLPRNLVKLAERGSSHARAVLRIAEENPKEQERIGAIRRSGKVTKEDYDYYLNLI